MSQLNIQPPVEIIKATVTLPLSKSIANRMLIIGYITGNEDLVKFPDCADSITMRALLQKLRSKSYFGQYQNNSHVDIQDNIYNTGDAGTVFRFLSALLSITPGTALLTGSDRMLERPCGPLIDSLIELGAHCSYTDKHGYPPVLIEGKRLKGGTVAIDASVSSQFVSALMMIAPLMSDGLLINFKGFAVSQPYIHLTADLMRKNGIKVTVGVSSVIVNPGDYTFKEGIHEADWSAASYWYTMAALLKRESTKESPIILNGLKFESMQGDRLVAKIYEQLGIESKWCNGDLHLNNTGNVAKHIDIDLNGQPDLAPALAVACAGLQVSATIRGLETLVIKESNRLESIKSELKKLGYICQIEANNALRIIVGRTEQTSNVIETYNDHRIAMAMAMLCLTNGPLLINNPEVVRKSYPEFWTDLTSTGFIID